MSYGEVLPIWWNMFWRFLLASVLLGFLLGIPFGLIKAHFGIPPGGISTLLYSLFAAIPASIWALRGALNAVTFDHSSPLSELRIDRTETRPQTHR